MSAKAIREATGKDLLNRLLDTTSGAARCKFAAVNETTNWDELVANNPWLKTEVCDREGIANLFEKALLTCVVSFSFTVSGSETRSIDKTTWKIGSHCC